MSKKTVNVSQQLLTSILIGFLLALFIVIIGHLFQQKWSAIPLTKDNSSMVPMNTPVGACSWECVFGERHSADCSGHDVSNFSQTTVSINEIFSASFEHFSLILILGLIASVLTILR